MGGQLLLCAHHRSPFVAFVDGLGVAQALPDGRSRLDSFRTGFGPHGALQSKALEAAKSVTAVKFIDANERSALRENDELIPTLEEELESDQDDSDDDE
ncbi:hypothetical protein ACVI1L_004985 [Bradyrhizobium sp. USDA 4516]